VTIEGPELRLTAKAAETFGLAVHELATNAVKYGAFSRQGGKLDVRWSVHGSKHQKLRFEWTETVPGGTKSPNRRGFGTELIERMLEYEMGAKSELDYKSSGLVCTIEVPLTENILANSGA